MLGITLKVGVEASMAFDRKNRREIKFTRLKHFFTTPMGTMGMGGLNGCKGTQQESQKQKARPEHEMRRDERDQNRIGKDVNESMTSGNSES